MGLNCVILTLNRKTRLIVRGVQMLVIEKEKL